jgi:hypothetical protein
VAHDVRSDHDRLFHPGNQDRARYVGFEVEVTAAGGTVKEPAREVGGGRLVATVTDPDGNVLGLLQDR